MSDESESDGVDRDVLYRRGPITCASVERRRLLEQVGREHRVTFVGDALEAGRQAEAGENLEAETGDDVREKTGFADQAKIQERGFDE